MKFVVFIMFILIAVIFYSSFLFGGNKEKRNKMVFVSLAVYAVICAGVVLSTG